MFLVGTGDNTTHHIKDVIFFDGVKITPSELIAIHPDDIKSVRIQVNNNTKEILIFSNTAPAPLKPD